MLKYYYDKYRSQEMCEVLMKKSVDACLSLLKFFLYWFITNEILDYLDNALFFNDDIVFVNADSDNVTFLLIIWVLLM